MRVFYGFDNLPSFRSPIVTVGSYDGVHKGHRVLLGKTVEIARQKSSESIVVTFAPHPRTVLESNEKVVYLLNTLEEKIMLLKSVGIDNLIVAPFTREFSMVSSFDFIRHYMINKIGVQTLVVGYNHHFGYNKEGNYDYLDRLQDEFEFEIYRQSRQDVDNQKVSSTIIRQLIEQGDITKANYYLGAPYIIIAENNAKGELIVKDQSKLMPPPGNYEISVQGTKYSMNIYNDRQISIHNYLLPLPERFVIEFQ